MSESIHPAQVIAPQPEPKRFAMSRLRGGADPKRVMSRINHLASLTAGEPGDGVTRPGYTALEREAHDWFAKQVTPLGFTVRTDSAGNSIAELPGIDPARPSIGTGSHLDSVPHGGRFDGIVGVVGAVEAAELLHENQVRLRHPLRLVVFACEEGARFGLACVGSRLAAGLTSSADLDHLIDGSGTTAADAFRRIGLNPREADNARWNPADWAGFVELHIEQGNVLHAGGARIGVVDVVSGSTRLSVTTRGRASHSGGTPMRLRRDAFLAAAEIALAGERIARDSRHHGTRVTVGRVAVRPGSITTIPGETTMSVDIRDTDSLRQRGTAAELVDIATQICERRRCTLEWRVIGDASPTFLSGSVRAAISSAAAELRTPVRVLTSGASHDAQMINRIVPTAMIFVPSLAGGVSHDPAELSSGEDIALGAEVLAATLITLDGRS